MTTTAREELMAAIKRLNVLCPELRFGQLVADLATIAKGLDIGAIWDTEDEELLSVARRQIEFFEQRQEGVPIG